MHRNQRFLSFRLRSLVNSHMESKIGLHYDGLPCHTQNIPLIYIDLLLYKLDKKLEVKKRIGVSHRGMRRSFRIEHQCPN